MPKHNYDSLAPEKFEFTYGGKDYVLWEPTEAGYHAYTVLRYKDSEERGDTLKLVYENSVNSEHVLIQACMREAEGDKEVPLQAVRAMPPRVTSDLFKRAKAMAGIGEVPVDPKASSAGTDTTSG